MGIKRNFIYSSLLTVSSFLFPMLTFPYVSRVLGVTNIGVCNFVDSIINYFILFSSMGINVVGIREIAKAKGNTLRVSKVFSSLWILEAGMTAIMLFLLLIATVFISQLNEYASLMMIGACKLIANLFLIEWFYRGIEEFKYITYRSLIVKVLYVACIFIFIHQPSDYPVYYTLSVLLVVFNAVFNIFYSRRFVGFVLDRNVIDEFKRPKILSGEEGSPRYKRIFGELELEGFDVSFTKSSFQDDDEFSTFIEILKGDIDRDKSLDLFGQAQNYTKPKTQADKTRAAQQLVKTIADEISKPMELPVEPIEVPTTIAKTSITTTVVETPSQTEPAQTIENESFEIPAIETEVKPSASTSFRLVINGVSESSSKGLYSLVNKPDGKYYATINLSNGFFERFRNCLSSEDSILQLAYFIKNLVVTELLLLQSGTPSAAAFRNKFNQLFGLI